MNYAGFWRRFAASAIDGIILAIPGLLIGGTVRTMTVGLGVNLILAILYYPVFESSVMMGTPGKSIMGLVVVSESTGERLTFKAALIRLATRYLSMLLIYIGYFMQLFTAKRQTLHDMLSEAVVINQPSVDHNYFSVWKDQFKDVVAKI